MDTINIEEGWYQVEKDKLKHKKYVKKFRDKFIPSRYNQIYLMDYLLDDRADHYISISNRADGKSFNYCHFLLKYSLDFGVGFTFLVRHYTVRFAGVTILQKIIDTFTHFKPEHFHFVSGDFYITVIYRDRRIGIITDLNQATDLKYLSNFLQDFPIIIYDEFLALEGDYLPDEWEKLKTIYSSINRVEEIPMIKIPKIIYLGNAVNFSSPVLVNLNLYNILEKHPMNKVGLYDNVYIEFNKNEKANEIRNLRAFKEELDKLTHGEFEVNNHNIATEKDRSLINRNPDYIYVKLQQFYLKIIYNKDTRDAILSIVNYAENYDYNTELVDNKDGSVYLKDSFYSENHEKRYEKNYFLFDNQYSKDMILDEFSTVKNLKINKIISHFESHQEKDNFELKEKVNNENYITNTLKYIANRFLDYE